MRALVCAQVEVGDGSAGLGRGSMWFGPELSRGEVEGCERWHADGEICVCIF